jgi:hypothetical protein
MVLRMHAWPGKFAALLIVLCAATIAAPAVSAPDEAGQKAAGTKSLKERLSDKASDEQRVDNCRVPLDRRGSKQRPDCPPAQQTSKQQGERSGEPAAAR